MQGILSPVLHTLCAVLCSSAEKEKTTLLSVIKEKLMANLSYPLCAVLQRIALCFDMMLLPLLQAFKGDYKWILYGDDDTFFFVDGVLELLQDFDPSLPYFITGMSSANSLRSRIR